MQVIYQLKTKILKIDKMACIRCAQLEARIIELEKTVFNKKCKCNTNTFLHCDICYNFYCNSCVLTCCYDCKRYMCIDCRKLIGKYYCAECYDKNIPQKNVNVV